MIAFSAKPRQRRARLAGHACFALARQVCVSSFAKAKQVCVSSFAKAKQVCVSSFAKAKQVCVSSFAKAKQVVDRPRFELGTNGLKVRCSTS
jgi:hypothetical protein